MKRRSLLGVMGATALAPLRSHATEADLRADIDIVRDALQLHPGLYRYATPQEVDARLDALARAFSQAPTLAQRYLLLSSFLAMIRCGHTWCNFSNQRRAVAGELFERPTRLPFLFTWIDLRMVVTRDPLNLGVPPGTEVLVINGMPSAAVLLNLMTYARADGGNDAKRIALMGVAGNERVEPFDVFHGLQFGDKPPGVHALQVKSPGESWRKVEVPAVDLAARRAMSPRGPVADDAPAWTWEMRADGVAVLTMPTWALYRTKWRWQAWLDERLDSLDGQARGLVVDLRDNEGGMDCGDELLARLTQRPIAPPVAERLVRYERTPPHLDRYLDTWDPSFRTLGVGATPAANGFLRLQPDPQATIVPKGTRVQVPVAALVGPVNSSATFQFAELARSTGLVRLFGEPTGGSQRGINGGRYFFVRLPASGLEFDLPLVGYYPAGTPPDAGVQPDVRVRRTAADWASGADPAMEAAARWCRET